MNGTTEQTEDFLNDCDDLDWVTDTLEKLALVQIALFDGTVYVIQMKSILEELDRNESSDDALSLAHLAEVLSDEKLVIRRHNTPNDNLTVQLLWSYLRIPAPIV